MERERKEKNVVILALVVAIISLSIAFAATLSSTLKINGTATMADAKWKVYFKSAVTDEASTLKPSEEPEITSSTTINYTITLEEGKTYILDTVIANEGTYNAKLNKLTLSGAEGLDGLITYSSTGLNEGDIISASDEANLTINLTMATITNDNISLVDNARNLNLTVVAEFVQAD